MARTPKLTDLQLILLTTAAQRSGGSLLPPPDSVSEQHDRIAKAIASLNKRGLAAEVEVTQLAVSWRQEADRLIGACISDAGRSAIGLDVPPVSSPNIGSEPSAGPAEEEIPSSASHTSAPREGSKQALVVTMMSRVEGATLLELVEATGWLPHTTRAALTRLRKKGHAIRKDRCDEVTCYYLGGAA